MEWPFDDSISVDYVAVTWRTREGGPEDCICSESAQWLLPTDLHSKFIPMKQYTSLIPVDMSTYQPQPQQNQATHTTPSMEPEARATQVEYFCQDHP